MQVTAHLVCLAGSMQSGLSSERVFPSVWFIIHGHVGSLEATDGKADSWPPDHLFQLGSPPGWGRRPRFRPRSVTG